MLKCMICGREMKQVNGGHIKSHGITTIQYKEMFPDAKLIEVSDKHRESARENMIKRNKTDEHKQLTIERNKSEEMRKKVSIAMTGKIKSEEHKQALKDAKANEDQEHRAKINGDNRRGSKHTKETIEHIAKSSFQKHPFRGKGGFREDLGHFVRSTWEANMARIYKYKGTIYEFESKVFWLKKEDGLEVSYTPDFYLHNVDLYIEVKGFWMPDAIEKFELFKEQYPKVKIHVIDKVEYAKYENHFKPLIKEWE